jgi:hypothetical protein
MYVEMMMTDPDVAEFLPSSLVHVSATSRRAKKGEDENLQANRPTAADHLSTDEKNQ